MTPQLCLTHSVTVIQVFMGDLQTLDLRCPSLQV